MLIIFNLKIIQQWGNESDVITTSISRPNGAARAVVLEALKEQKTLAQLSGEFELYAQQISEWKKQVVSGIPSLFGEQKTVFSDEDKEAITAPLYQQIGQLKTVRRRGRVRLS